MGTVSVEDLRTESEETTREAGEVVSHDACSGEETINVRAL